MMKQWVMKKLKTGSFGIDARASVPRGPLGNVVEEASADVMRQLESVSGLKIDTKLQKMLVLPRTTTDGTIVAAWSQGHGTEGYRELAKMAYKPTGSAEVVFKDKEAVFIEVSDVKSVLEQLKKFEMIDCKAELVGWNSSMCRWDWLSTVMPPIKKTRVGDSTLLFNSSASMPSVRWKMIMPAYKGVIVPHAEDISDVSADKVEKLAAILSVWKCGCNKLEKKRSEVLKSMMMALQVHARLVGQVRVDGKQIKCHGILDSSIENGDRRIGVIEMTTANMAQGKTQALLGCEVLRDVDGLHEAIGIVSTLENWTLMRVKDEEVLLEEGLTIDFDENGNPNRESLKILAGKLVHLLTLPTESSPSSQL